MNRKQFLKMISIAVIVTFSFALGFASVAQAGPSNCCDYQCPGAGVGDGYLVKVGGQYYCFYAWPDHPECISDPPRFCNIE